MTAGLAEINNTKSFHLLILPLAGTWNAYRPFAGAQVDKVKSIDAEYFTISPRFKLGEPYNPKLFLDISGKNENCFVLDLRALRPLLADKKSEGISEGFEEIVWSFDAVLIMPRVTASTLLN